MRVAFFALILCLASASACHVKVDANTPPPPAKVVPVGPTPSINGHHEQLTLAEGKYKGDLVVTGNHNRVVGAGYGKTIVDGKLLVSGNHNTVSGVTIEGGGTIEGNENDATKAQFHGDVTTRN